MKILSLVAAKMVDPQHPERISKAVDVKHLYMDVAQMEIKKPKDSTLKDVEKFRNRLKLGV